jgi:pyruvate-formate lyase
MIMLTARSSHLCSFLDTYFEEDLRKGSITEQQVQELVDQFVMKMRIVRWVGGTAAGRSSCPHAVSS